MRVKLLLIVLTFCLIKDFYFLPSSINIILHFVSCVTALISDIAMFFYQGKYQNNNLLKLYHK